ncbi:MAG: hypothetical protein WCQ89_17650 [Verrucomicrobiota bacterium]
MKRLFVLLAVAVATTLSLAAADKKIVLVAGKPSHPPCGSPAPPGACRHRRSR